MKRAYAKRRANHKSKPTAPGNPKPEPTTTAAPTEAAGREIQLPLGRAEMISLLQGSLDGVAMELGLEIAHLLLEDEVDRLCGRRYEHQADREHVRYGHRRGTAVLRGQKAPIVRPRVRRADGTGEAPLSTYAQMQSPDVMPESVFRHMVRGTSTRDYEEAIDLACEGFGVGKSSVWK